MTRRWCFMTLAGATLLMLLASGLFVAAWMSDPDHDPALVSCTAATDCTTPDQDIPDDHLDRRDPDIPAHDNT